MDEELRKLAERQQLMNETLIRHVTEISEWRRYVDSWISRSEERNTRAPTLLFAGISLLIGVTSVLVQLWISGRP